MGRKHITSNREIEKIKTVKSLMRINAESFLILSMRRSSLVQPLCRNNLIICLGRAPSFVFYVVRNDLLLCHF